jgi:hypothetical protein
MKREDAKEIHKFIIDTIKREKYGFVTDNKLDLSSATVGSLPARKVVITDAGNHYTSTYLEDALQEISATVSGIIASGVVTYLNSLVGNITIVGAGTVSVSVVGQTITISGS